MRKATGRDALPMGVDCAGCDCAKGIHCTGCDGCCDGRPRDLDLAGELVGEYGGDGDAMARAVVRVGEGEPAMGARRRGWRRGVGVGDGSGACIESDI